MLFLVRSPRSPLLQVEELQTNRPSTASTASTARDDEELAAREQSLQEREQNQAPQPRPFGQD